MIEEMSAEARRLDRSLAFIVQLAVRRALSRIAEHKTQPPATEVPWRAVERRVRRLGWPIEEALLVPIGEIRHPARRSAA